jgi:protein CpxP
MKRIFVAVPLAIALSATLAVAQATTQPDSAAAPATKGHHGHHGHNPQREAAMLSKRLNLTSDQQAKLEPILADRDQKISTLKSDTSLTPDQKKAQFKAIHQDTKQQLSTVLTPEQIEQLHSQRHHGKHPHSQPQPLPQSAPPSGA